MSTEKQTQGRGGTLLEEQKEVPAMYNVVLLNDNFTPFDFVIMILMKNFRKSLEEAEAITKSIHENQRGIAGTYIKEIAEDKRDLTVAMAKAHSFPLRCIVEEDHQFTPSQPNQRPRNRI